MMRRALYGHILTLALVTGGLTALPGSASAHHCDPADAANQTCHTAPVITTPAEVIAGSTGPVTIDFSPAPTDWYEVAVRSNDGGAYNWSVVHEYDGTDAQVSLMLDEPLAKGTYDVTVVGTNHGRQATATLTVVPAPLAIERVAASPLTFYPLVRDGYRDTTKFSFTLNLQARVLVRVFNSKAVKIRGVDLGSRSGTQSWTWTGRGDDGRRVSPGTYIIRVYATRNGVTRRAGVYVKVATSYKISTASKALTGYETYSTSKAPSCYVDHYYYDQTADVNCWGGDYAIATYRFTLPSTAYGITWAVAGYQHCCDTGTITRWGERTSSTAYRVRIKVTRWRAYMVERVRVSYTYKAKI